MPLLPLILSPVCTVTVLASTGFPLFSEAVLDALTVLFAEVACPATLHSSGQHGLSLFPSCYSSALLRKSFLFRCFYYSTVLSSPSRCFWERPVSWPRLSFIKYVATRVIASPPSAPGFVSGLSLLALCSPYSWKPWPGLALAITLIVQLHQSPCGHSFFSLPLSLCSSLLHFHTNSDYVKSSISQ